jgi:hypothetical protein
MTVGGLLQFSAYCYSNSGVTDKCSSRDVYGYAVTGWVASNTSAMASGQVGGTMRGLVVPTGAGVAYIQAQIGSIGSSEWVVNVSGGNPPAITIKGRVSFKGRVTPN